MIVVRPREISPELLKTAIVDFKVEPSKVAVGEPITISGYAKFYVSIPFFEEHALEGQKLQIYVNNEVIGEVTTGDEGYFSYIWIPEYSGNYVIYAKFPGTWEFDPCESPKIAVEVKTREEIEEEERNFWLMVGVGAGLALLGIGVAVYLYREQRMMELMMAARR